MQRSLIFVDDRKIFGQVPFYSCKKMSISDDVRSDDVRPEDAPVKRFRHSEFLYFRNGQYKTVELMF